VKFCVKSTSGMTLSCHKTKKAARIALKRARMNLNRNVTSRRMKLRVVKTSTRERSRITRARRAGTW
jgi:hypothetical protein